jgi:signal transduction histidine kinase
MSPPVPWVAPVLYVGVLIAGGYAGLAGLGETRPALFLGGLAAAAALDWVERRRHPAGAPRWAAAGLLAVRFVLFVIIAAGDGSGMSRVLFLLLPFTAYFALGRAVSIAVGIGCVGFVAAVFQLTVPQWYRQTEQVSDLLMFSVGLVLTIAMAAVAGNERLARTQLLEANEVLRASAAQLAELSATAERNRLARDIHDGLGHHLTAIAVLLEKAATFRDRDATAADLAIENARRSARHALEDVRRSVTALSGGTPPFRLANALDELANEVDDGRLSVTVNWQGDESRFEPEGLMALYRAAQEGLTNVRRHANATHATVTVHCGPTGAHLVVTDDGRGFAPEQEGFGLRGMRERVRLAGGSVSVDSRPGAGTRLAVAIPHRSAP